MRFYSDEWLYWCWMLGGKRKLKYMQTLRMDGVLIKNRRDMEGATNSFSIVDVTTDDVLHRKKSSETVVCMCDTDSLLTSSV